MFRRVKQLLPILPVPIVCLGVGLWMQGRFTVNSVKNGMTLSASSDLEHDASEFASQIKNLYEKNNESTDFILGEIEGLVRRRPSNLHWATLVDANWESVIASNGPYGPGQSENSAVIGHWERRESVGALAWSLTHGELELGEERHLAVAIALPENWGHLVIHESKSRIDALSANVTSELPLIGLVTYLWLSTLFAIASYLLVARMHDLKSRAISQSNTQSLRRIQNLVRTRDAVIFGLAKLAESRDPETGHHLERISVYSTMLASELQRHPQYRQQVTPGFVRLIGISSALHDIGKVGIPDRVLLKPAVLTPDERTLMETHANIGGDCLREIEQRLGESSFLRMAKDIALAHHEHWDGQGYPNQIAGEQIPLAARIVALADIYDALSSVRVYKDALPHEECMEIIRLESGKKLDPEIVKLWLAMESRFRSVAYRYDSATEVATQSQDAFADCKETIAQAFTDLQRIPQVTASLNGAGSSNEQNG